MSDHVKVRAVDISSFVGPASVLIINKRREGKEEEEVKVSKRQPLNRELEHDEPDRNWTRSSVVLTLRMV